MVRIMSIEWHLIHEKSMKARGYKVAYYLTDENNKLLHNPILAEEDGLKKLMNKGGYLCSCWIDDKGEIVG